MLTEAEPESPPAQLASGADVIIDVNGESLLLDACGAAFLPHHRTLVFADLHFEKGSSYARSGQLLPPYDTAATLLRMARAVARHRPSRVIALGDSFHEGVQRLVRDLNRLYRDTPALHALDYDAAGFEWLVADDASNSTFAWLRKGKEAHERCVVVVNFTPQVLNDYRLRVPFAGTWREVLNSDAGHYGGSNVGNAGTVSTVVTRHGPELHIVVPPLAAVFFVPASE